MTLQNVSIVLSPTMQISHRVLNIFFAYSKILFKDTVIKRYCSFCCYGSWCKILFKDTVIKRYCRCVVTARGVKYSSKTPLSKGIVVLSLRLVV